MLLFLSSYCWLPAHPLAREERQLGARHHGNQVEGRGTAHLPVEKLNRADGEYVPGRGSQQLGARHAGSLRPRAEGGGSEVRQGGSGKAARKIAVGNCQ